MAKYKKLRQEIQKSIDIIKSNGNSQGKTPLLTSSPFLIHDEYLTNVDLKVLKDNTPKIEMCDMSYILTKNMNKNFDAQKLVQL